jgi:tRNA-uridine 2-sulfurtransferase
VRLPEFLQQQLKPKTGNIIEIDRLSPLYAEVHTDTSDLQSISKAIRYSETDGKKAGEHNGAHYFTIGQRKGLNIGGKAEGMFVLATDTETNTIYVGMGEDHPGLMRKGLFIPEADIHWIRPDLSLKNGETSDFMVRIRYRQALVKASLHKQETGMYIVFEQPVKAVAPGQFAAWYANDELLGSGVIG